MSAYGGETGYKLSKAGTYLGVAFDGNQTLQANDEVTVFVTTTSPKLQLFADNGETLIAETDEVALGENIIVLDSRANGAHGLYVYRVLGGTEGAQYNAYVAYISVERPCLPDESPTAVETISDLQSPITNRVFRDGVLYILRGNHTYTLSGQRIE